MGVDRGVCITPADPSPVAHTTRALGGGRGVSSSLRHFFSSLLLNRRLQRPKWRDSPRHLPGSTPSSKDGVRGALLGPPP